MRLDPDRRALKIATTYKYRNARGSLSNSSGAGCSRRRRTCYEEDLVRKHRQVGLRTYRARCKHLTDEPAMAATRVLLPRLPFMHIFFTLNDSRLRSTRGGWLCIPFCQVCVPYEVCVISYWRNPAHLWGKIASLAQQQQESSRRAASSKQRCSMGSMVSAPTSLISPAGAGLPDP